LKVVYIISDIDKALAFEWIAQEINKSRFSLSFILLNPGTSALENYLKENNLDVRFVRCRGKKDWAPAAFKTYRILRKIKPQVVHCHLIQANIIGLIAARIAGVPNRVYTRHHSSLHHTYFPKGVWWDKLSNQLATHIVAISGVVKKILIEWEKAKTEKVVLIPHGFLLEEFRQVTEDRVIAFRERYDLPDDKLIIGVISRFTEWKGIQYIIPAFQNFLKENPQAILILLNAQGDYEHKIKELLSSIPETKYRMIRFEKDVAAAYKAMSIFVHAPIDEHSEAFGQIYVEALGAGVPSVFTLSGIAADFITHKQNACVVPFKDSEAITKALIELTNSPQLQQELKKEGWESVREKFSLSVMIQKLENLYAAG
jgi:glycosyltransferase involved in cell wall biosynthesis